MGDPGRLAICAVEHGRALACDLLDTLVESASISYGAGGGRADMEGMREAHLRRASRHDRPRQHGSAKSFGDGDWHGIDRECSVVLELDVD